MWQISINIHAVFPKWFGENTPARMQLISSSCGGKFPGKERSLFPVIVCTVPSAGANVPLVKSSQMTQTPARCWNLPAAKAAFVRMSHSWSKSPEKPWAWAQLYFFFPSASVATRPSWPCLMWKVCDCHPFLLESSRGSRHGNEDTSAVWRHRSDSHDELWPWPTIQRESAARSCKSEEQRKRRPGWKPPLA